MNSLQCFFLSCFKSPHIRRIHKRSNNYFKSPHIRRLHKRLNNWNSYLQDSTNVPGSRSCPSMSPNHQGSQNWESGVVTVPSACVRSSVQSPFKLPHKPAYTVYNDFFCNQSNINVASFVSCILWVCYTSWRLMHQSEFTLHALLDV